MGSVWGALLTTVVMGLVYAYRIQTEEQTLVQYFQQEYQQYRQETKKMFPFLW